MKRLFVFVVCVVLFLGGLPVSAGGSGSGVVEGGGSHGFLVGVPHLGEVEVVLGEIVAEGVCVEWLPVALRAGWAVEDVPRLLRIMFRESRCLPGACSVSDSGRVCRDWGLMQVNDYSWKSTVRGLGLEMDQMWDPFWNLWFAKWLFDYSEGRNGDGWVPWTPSKW